MTHVNRTNQFFKEKVYSNLASFALSPVSWPYPRPGHEGNGNGIPNVIGVFFLYMFSPILVPAALGTSAIALSLAAASALVHGLSLAVAGIADASSNEDDRTLSPG